MNRAPLVGDGNWLPGGAPIPGAEALPWEQEPQRAGSDQDGWLLSFIDVLTLLLALFVLLLAHQQQIGKTAGSGMPAAVAAAPTATAQRAADASADVMGSGDAAAGDGPSVTEPVSGERGLAHSEPELEVDPEAVRPAWPRPDYFNLPQALFVDAAELWPLHLSALQRAEPAAADADEVLLAALADSGLTAQVEMRRQPGGVDLEISDSVLFAPASADLTAGGLALLDQLAAALRDRPHRLSVEGHTDDRPISTARYPSNWELSMARAARVTRHLIGQGLAPDRVRAIGYADTRPRAGNDSPEGRARNRRVSFLLRQPAD